MAGKPPPLQNPGAPPEEETKGKESASVAPSDLQVSTRMERFWVKDGPTNCSPSGTGEQTQDHGSSRIGDDLPRPVSPNAKETVSQSVDLAASGTHSSGGRLGVTMSEVEPLLSQSVLGHKQCAMLFRTYVSRNAAGCGWAVLEGVGLSHEDIQMCYENSPQNEEKAVQSGLMKWRDGCGRNPTWTVLITAMDYAKIGVQHVQAMKEELFKGIPTASKISQSVSIECTPEVQSKRVSVEKMATLGSMDKVLSAPPCSQIGSLESYKTDIVSCDMSVLKSKKQAKGAIKSLFFNAYSLLIHILGSYFNTIKTVALEAVRSQQVTGSREEVMKVTNLSSLFECLDVDRNWNDLHFLEVAISRLPPEALKEKETARVVLGHYKSHFSAYVKATCIKEGMSVFGRLPCTRGREETFVVTEVTVDEDINEYTCKDCLDLWKLFLIKALEIPEDRIQLCNARPGNSTVLVFMVSQTFACGIEEKLFKPDVVWLIQQLGILRVHVPVMFNVDLQEVLPNVPTVSIRDGLQSGTDFIALTTKWPPLMCSLVDQVPSKQARLDWVPPFSAGLAELSFPNPVGKESEETGKPDPVAFQNECKEFPLVEESEDVPKILRSKKGVNEQQLTCQLRKKPKSAFQLATGPLDTGIRSLEKVWRPTVTTRKHAQSDDIRQKLNTVAELQELPVSSPLVAYDTESQQELIDRLSSERDRVPYTTSGHTSRASDSENQLTLSLSDTTEEHGEDPRLAHEWWKQKKS